MSIAEFTTYYINETFYIFVLHAIFTFVAFFKGKELGIIMVLCSYVTLSLLYHTPQSFITVENKIFSCDTVSNTCVNIMNENNTVALSWLRIVASIMFLGATFKSLITIMRGDRT